MKFVLNRCFGGPSLSRWAANQLHTDTYNFDRDDPKLIALIEKYGSEKCNGNYAALQIVEIPDNATDYELDDYDGFESITYVVNGRLYHI